MEYVTTEEHKGNNPKPLIIMKETRLKLGERSDDSGSWPNWIYCYTLDGISEGWAPEQIIQIDGDYGIALGDYFAKELDVKKDEIVEGNKELNGWVWCSKLNSTHEGWLPKEKLIVKL